MFFALCTMVAKRVSVGARSEASLTPNNAPTGSRTSFKQEPRGSPTSVSVPQNLKLLVPGPKYECKPESQHSQDDNLALSSSSSQHYGDFHAVNHDSSCDTSLSGSLNNANLEFGETPAPVSASGSVANFAIPTRSSSSSLFTFSFPRKHSQPALASASKSRSNFSHDSTDGSSDTSLLQNLHAISDYTRTLPPHQLRTNRHTRSLSERFSATFKAYRSSSTSSIRTQSAHRSLPHTSHAYFNSAMSEKLTLATHIARPDSATQSSSNSSSVTHLSSHTTPKVTTPTCPSSPRLPVKETNHVSIDINPVTGRKILNTYEILKQIGCGQHGKVKLARHNETNELVVSLVPMLK